MNWRCAASRAAAVLLALPLRAAAQGASVLTRGPYLTDVSSVSANVCWREESGDDYCQPIANVPAGAAFSYTLPRFRVSWTARTLPPSWDPTRFAVFGDAGDGSPAQERVARILKAGDPQFALLTGDIVYPDGAEADYDAHYFNVYADIIAGVCFFPTVGNHDYGNAWTAKAGRRRFNEGYAHVFRRHAYYSFDAGPVHIAAIDTNAVDRVGAAEPLDPAGAQLKWLDDDLASAAAPWKIVFMHVPLYSTRRGHGDNAALRKSVQPILEKRGVALAFAGHEHIYQRSKPIRGVTYITVGTGGAKLEPPGAVEDWLALELSAHGLVVVDASSASLRAVFYDVDGRPRDVVTLNKP